ncbi:MAG: GreA/GreB family elongation factor [Selenomonadaceae bacterium]|nr:GreA/GreB family elongation factor [Selenomonadaceae bacterium]
MHWRIGNELMQKKVNDVVKLAKGFNNAIFYEVTDIVEVVTLGSKVRIRFPENINNPYKDTDENYDKVTDTYTYTIVGTTETNPDEGKISDESPVGDALLGQPAGSVVPVYSPRGILSYEIVDIIQN